MQSITFECEVITPMFLAGADGSTPELRPPSIKGALRFWWRAMNGDKDLKALKKREGEIFGSTIEPVSKSKVIIRKGKERFKEEATNDKIRVFDDDYMIGMGNRKMSILDYLAYGTQEFRTKNFIRHYIPSGSRFQFKIVTPDEYKDEVMKAMYLFSHYGGLGSRSRNGLGSFQITSPELEAFNVYDIEFDKANYSALSDHTLIFQGKEHSNYLDALCEIGMAYHTSKNELNGYDRQFIALPLNGVRLDRNDRIKLDRHLKPYFLSVHKNENGSYQGKILFIPYNYATGFKDSRNKLLDKKTLETYQQDYFDITTYFNEGLENNLEKVL